MRKTYERPYFDGPQPWRELPAGWEPIMERMVEHLDSIEFPEGVKLGNIKEKFGVLNVYIYADDMSLEARYAFLNEHIKQFVDESRDTCYVCGTMDVDHSLHTFNRFCSRGCRIRHIEFLKERIAAKRRAIESPETVTVVANIKWKDRDGNQD